MFKLGAAMVAGTLLTGCANIAMGMVTVILEPKPERLNYETVENFTPDCPNALMQVSYLSNLKKSPVNKLDNKELYDRTIDIQIERIKNYCEVAQ